VKRIREASRAQEWKQKQEKRGYWVRERMQRLSDPAACG
jgi:hypothetical protein